MTDDDATLILRQLRDYDRCFAEFLQPSGNGQKIMQAILLREAFHRFAQQQVGIRAEAATAILDVSCGPGGYSVAWTSQIASFLPKGMVFIVPIIRAACRTRPAGLIVQQPPPKLPPRRSRAGSRWHGGPLRS